jgi:luciferase family oxidoreductase group 1
MSKLMIGGDRIRGERNRLFTDGRGCNGYLMVPLSVLDLSPIVEGGSAGQSLRNSLDLARHVEALGYRRFWMAEHHNLPGIASAATAVALAHVAAGTNNIKIGAGGIMLPNHAPLVIAEQFGTLAALHPGRVELGLGRARGPIRSPTRPFAETSTAMSTIFRAMSSR